MLQQRGSLQLSYPTQTLKMSSKILRASPTPTQRQHLNNQMARGDTDRGTQGPDASAVTPALGRS